MSSISHLELLDGAKQILFVRLHQQLSFSQRGSSMSFELSTQREVVFARKRVENVSAHFCQFLILCLSWNKYRWSLDPPGFYQDSDMTVTDRPLLLKWTLFTRGVQSEPNRRDWVVFFFNGCLLWRRNETKKNSVKKDKIQKSNGPKMESQVGSQEVAKSCFFLFF